MRTLFSVVIALPLALFMRTAWGQSSCGNPPQPPDACGVCGGTETDPDCCPGNGPGPTGPPGSGGSGGNTGCPICGGGPGGGPGVGNPFNPYSGSVGREVLDLQLAHAVGAQSFNLTRFFASRWDAYPHIDFDMPLGSAGYWRHSWQWSILDFGTNENGQERIRIIYPSGRFGNFAKVTAASEHMTFLACTHERVLAEGTNYYLMFLDGTRHYFTKWTNSNTKLFRMEATIDPHSNRYSYTYSGGRLSQVRGPNTNQWLTFSYQLATNSITAGDVEFSFTDNTATQVLLAGSFNNWQAQPMTNSAGQWTRTETLEEGPQFYKFIARYSGDPNDYWNMDPENPLWAYTGSPGNLNSNSVIMVDQYFLSQVSASDGRTVSYSYGTQWMPAIDKIELPLIRATYGNGTYGEYTYYHASNDLYRKALMKSADDPHYDGPARAVQYTYQTNLAYSGEVFEERSLVDSHLLARLVLDDSKPDRRVVVSGTGDEEVHDFGEFSSLTNTVGYTYRAVHFGGDGMLAQWIDPKARTNVYQRTWQFGRATSIWNSVRGSRVFTYTEKTIRFSFKKPWMKQAGLTCTQETVLIVLRARISPTAPTKLLATPTSGRCSPTASAMAPFGPTHTTAKAGA